MYETPRTREQMATDAELIERLVALVERGQVVHLRNPHPDAGGELHTYLKATPDGFRVVAGAEHRTTRVGPKELRGWISSDVHDGWREPAEQD